ncbi:histidine phosphatase family protein [Glacieibacterium frigidum]|uniref:phosphoglycerate mutase (2,3-diphosphoglycerate-dependent) n=1 Tax=Glacieibacterium frigidum TaxID=2593303 RepID=A0A552UF91_9SPHN|nr:histidine phosphatase family protein [Glacieibacterium frigidum]TRW16880.1 histidine phosphatase family protein [Glacieibacterium frigidum]
MHQRWPERLWIVRHGQSAGNVAADAAEAAGHSRIVLDMRDCDVPLSDLGHDQAKALGTWFAALPAPPTVILNSPFLRARQTAQHVADAICPCEMRAADERLREREFGILDRLTRAGVTEFHPEQAASLTMLGKFYHRPPGGESWTDVILRLRSVLDTISLHHEGERVVIVAHQVVVLCLRYILEGLDEATILDIDRAGDVANCSVTEYEFGGGAPALVRYNHVAPVAAQAPVTRAPDAAVAAG